MEKRKAVKQAAKTRPDVLAKAIHGSGNQRILVAEMGNAREQQTYDIHRNAVRNASKKVDNDPPRIHFADVSPCMFQANDSHFRSLDKENAHLLQVMSRLYRRPCRLDNQLKERKILREACNERSRREMLRVTRENKSILQMLNKVGTVYSREEFLQDFERSKKKMDAIARFPVAWDEHKPIYQKQFMKTRRLVSWYPPLVSRRRQQLRRQQLYTQYVVTPTRKATPACSEQGSFQNTSGRRPSCDKDRYSVDRPPTQDEHDEMMERLTKTVATLIGDGDKSTKDDTPPKRTDAAFKSRRSTRSSDLYRISSSEQMSKATKCTMHSGDSSNVGETPIVKANNKALNNTSDIQEKTVVEETADEILFDVLDDTMTTLDKGANVDTDILDKGESDVFPNEMPPTSYDKNPSFVASSVTDVTDDVSSDRRESLVRRETRTSAGKQSKERSKDSRLSRRGTITAATIGSTGILSRANIKKGSLSASMKSQASVSSAPNKDASHSSKRLSRTSAGSRDKSSSPSNKDALSIAEEESQSESRTEL